MATPQQQRTIGQGRLNSPLRRHRMVPAQLSEACKPFVEAWLSRVKEFFANESAHVPLDDGLSVKDVIEGLSVQYSILLVPNLLHHRTTMRTEVFDLFIELVIALNPKLRDDPVFTQHAQLLLTNVNMDYIDVHACIDNLFHLISKHLDFVTLGLVAGLELYYTHPSTEIQQAAIAVVTRLIVENPDLFIKRDNLAAIWNLFFRLDISAPTYRNPALVGCRAAVCRSLALLAPMYCVHDRSLARQCLMHLLMMPDKSPREVTAIQTCLTSLFGEYRKFEDPELRTSLFEVFAHVISAQYEDNYDLLGWALQKCASITVLANVPDAAQPVIDFVRSIENHVHMSSPRMVRHGAAICIHTLLPLYPIILEKYPRAFSNVISGCLDADALVASHHLRTLLFIAERLRLNRVSREASELINMYNELDPMIDVLSPHHDWSQTPARARIPLEDRLVNLLKEARSSAPEVPAQELATILSNLEFATDYKRHRQLLLLEVWCGSATQVDPLFVQTLLPHLRSTSGEQQRMAIKILASLAPALSSSATNTHVIDGVESYCKALLRSNNDPLVIPTLLGAIPELPFDRLSSKKRHEFLDCIRRLIYHQHADIRAAAAQALGSCARFWRADDLQTRAFALSLLCLADEDQDCVMHAITSIEKLRQLTQDLFSDVIVKVDRVVKVLQSRYLPNKLAAFDLLVSTVLTGTKSGAVALRKLFSEDESTRSFIEEVFTDPDRPRTHFVNLVAMLYARIGTPRAEIANFVSPAQQRVLSFLQPELGSANNATRSAACYTIRRMCVIGDEVRYGYIRYVLQEALPYILNPKYKDLKEVEQWLFIQSSLLICRILVLMKARHLNSYILGEVFDRVLELMETEPSYPVKAACVEFCEAVLLTNPLTIADRLERMRDSMRLLFCFPHASLTDTLTRVYPLIFRQASLRPQVAQSYMEYLKNDLGPAMGETWEQDMDPLLARLSPAELKNIVVTSIHGLGAMRGRFLALPIIQELLFFIHHSDPDLRLSALQALHSQLTLVDSADAIRPRWISLPLIGDPNPSIRDAYERFLRNATPIYDHRQNSVPPEPDDAIPVSLVKEEDLVTSVAPAIVNIGDPKMRFQTARIDVEGLGDGEKGLPSFLEDPPDWTQRAKTSPVIQMSGAFLKRLQRTIASSIGMVNNSIASEVAYHLNAYVAINGLQAPALLVLSELWKHQISENPDPSYIVTSVEVLLYHIKRDLTRNTSNVIHACALALKNIADSSEPATVEILDRLTANPAPMQGELIGLRYIAEAVDDFVVERASAIVHQYIRFILSAGERNKPALQNAAIQVCSTYALISGNQDISDVIECLVHVRSKSKVPEVIRECDQSLGNILRAVGRDHPNIQALIKLMISKLRHRSPNVRVTAMDQFQLFCPFMTYEEMVFYSIRLLADPHIPVREKIIELLFEGHHPSLLSEVKKVAKALTSPAEPSRGDKLWGIMRGKARTALRMQKLLAARKDKKEPLVIPLPTIDYLNRAYLLSKGFVSWCKFWGLDKSAAPMGLQRAESAFNVFLPQSATIYADDIATLKEAVLTDVAPLLRTFILLDPNKGESILAELKDYVQTVLSGEFDRGMAMYNISLLTQILQSCDGIREDLPLYLDALHDFIRTCHTRIEALRTQIFENLDDFKFFSTSGSLGPITSQKQFDQMMEHRRMLEIAVQDKSESARLLSEHRTFHQNIAEDNATLRDLTYLMTKTVDGLGNFYSICESLDEEHLVSGFKNIFMLMGNTHRGVRDVTRHVMVDVALFHVDSIYLEASSRPSFVQQVQKTLSEIWQLLSNDVHKLKRRKLDYMHILAYLLHFVPERPLRSQVITYLMKQWDSADGAIRRYSIKLTQHLCETDMKEMVELLDTSDDGTPSLLMAELTKRLGDPEYPEKDSLNQLMKWYFAHAGDLSMSMYKRSK